jgi:hypothetical protein
MWSQFINVLLGIWLMAAPDVLAYGDPARTQDHIVGPMILSAAMIAVSEVTRPVRWINVPFGVWLIIAPWIIGYESVARWNSVIIGLLIMVCSMRKGTVRERFDGGWSVLWKSGLRGATMNGNDKGD